MSGYKRFGIPESFERGERGSVIRKSGEGIQNYFVGSVNQGTGVLGTYFPFSIHMSRMGIFPSTVSIGNFRANGGSAQRFGCYSVVFGG